MRRIRTSAERSTTSGTSSRDGGPGLPEPLRCVEPVRSALDAVSMTNDPMPKPATPKRHARTTDESLVLHLFDLTSHLGRLGERMASQVGLTTQQWIVLLQIGGDMNFPGAVAGRSATGVLPSEIAAARGVSRATVSVLVAALLARGLVRNIADSVDGRRKRLALTPAGEKILDQTDPLRRAANRRLFSALSVAERGQFLDYLKRCLEALAAASHQP